jgi:CBS domain-containing protein
MPTKIRDLMTTDPITLDSASTAMDAAMTMREEDVGDVLVRDGSDICGIVTDRDLVLRVIAAGNDPEQVKLGDVCTGELHACGPDDALEDAVRLMRDKKVRRLPVMEGGDAVGILSIGDLAVTMDPDSALADISAAPGNN